MPAARTEAKLDALMTEPLLRELLALWVETRSPQVAAMIEDVSRAEPRPPITGNSQRALQAAWLEVAGRNDPLDVDRLVAALVHGNLTHARERMACFAKRPPDPRIAAGLEAVLASPPSEAFVKGSSRGFWDAIFAELVRVADPRTRTIADRIAWLAHERASSPFDVGTLRARTVKAIAEVAVAIRPAAELSPAQEQQIAKLLPRTRAIPRVVDRGAELLARIYDDPRDLDARAVYADWLTANGDPRGELIALQLARPVPDVRPWRFIERDRVHRPTGREIQLLRTHHKQWLGKLGALFRHVSFERGFPAWGHLPRSIDVAAIAVPEAATFEYLSVGRDDFATGRRLAARPFHGLRALGNVGWQTLAGLLDQPGTTVRAIEVTHPAFPDDFAFLDREVQLDHLDIDLGGRGLARPTTASVHAFLRTRVVQRLQTLCLGWEVGNEAAFVEAFLASPIDCLEFSRFASEAVRITRTPRGLNVVIERGERDGGRAGPIVEMARRVAEVNVVDA